MRLIDAVILGKICGLETMEEYLCNVDIHAMNLFVYTEMNQEFIELNQDYSAYLAGDLILDQALIKREVEKAFEGMAASQPQPPVMDLELTVFEENV